MGPVLARAVRIRAGGQELCILLETYWQRNNLKAPIYFAAGLTEKVRSMIKNKN